MKNKFLHITTLAMVIFFYYSCSQPAKESQWMNIPLEDKKSATLTYEGMLPCADCPGLKTTLSLNISDNTFTLTETYLEAENGKDATYNSTGTFDVFTGNTTNPSAKIYRLNPGMGDSTMCFIEATDSILNPAMKNGDDIESEIRMELRLK